MHHITETQSEHKKQNICGWLSGGHKYYIYRLDVVQSTSSGRNTVTQLHQGYELLGYTITHHWATII